MVSWEELLAQVPAPNEVGAVDVVGARGEGARQLVVLDDDPTGTQSVADLPVLNSWAASDLKWALETGAPAVYVMTNSRSLPPDEAEKRNREVVEAAFEAAKDLGVEVDFVSRSDSTLRGHYPLEPDTLADEMGAHGEAIDGVVIVPAFGDAGRITVNGMHYAGSRDSGFIPVGETEFARDATFGYKSSYLPEWVEEKTEGKIKAEDVISITLEDLREKPEVAVQKLLGGSAGRPIVVDAMEESDLRLLTLALLEAQAAGRRFVFRVGPPFVRAYIGQDITDPLNAADVARIGRDEKAVGGLIVVGSHVDLTTRQLNRLRERRTPVEFEIDVPTILGADRDTHLQDLVAQVAESLKNGNVVLRTSRNLVTGADGDESLAISRSVSDAVVQVVRSVLDENPPKFVIAKGGITSSDVAARGLEIGRAIVQGPMLPGIVSLWEPIAGPAQGIPYIVFAGNVGDEESLADVTDKLSTYEEQDK